MIVTPPVTPGLTLSERLIMDFRGLWNHLLELSPQAVALNAGITAERHLLRIVITLERNVLRLTEGLGTFDYIREREPDPGNYH